MRKQRSDAGTKRVDANYRTFTFRLNVKRDADVIAKIDAFTSQRDDDGKPIPLHHLIIEALRGEPSTPRHSANIIEFFNDQLQRLEETIERLNEMGISPRTKKQGKPQGIDKGYLSKLSQALRGENE